MLADVAALSVRAKCNVHYPGEPAGAATAAVEKLRQMISCAYPVQRFAGRLAAESIWQNVAMREGIMKFRRELLAAFIVATFILMGVVHPAAVGDADGINLDLQPGPAVWREEYWEVKPEKLDEFVNVYRREVYSISRRIPGYRGYTFLTLLPPAQGEPQSTVRPADTGSLIRPHYGIHLEGKILTGRSINVGLLLARTHNVIIIHHCRNWTDADKFRDAFAQIYAKEHNGADVWERLSKTLFPLANNYWDTYFRLIKTGFLSSDVPPGPGADADGLNLNPRPEPSRWVKEYWDIDPLELDAFLHAYENESYSVARKVPGHRGVSIITTFPPGEGEPQQTAFSRRNYPLGGFQKFILPQPGLLMDGEIRTDRSINFSSLFMNTYTVITYHHLVTGASALTQTMNKIYADEHNGADRIKHITNVMFPHVRNHWDMVYRMIETSFTPDARVAARERE